MGNKQVKLGCVSAPSDDGERRQNDMQKKQNNDNHHHHHHREYSSTSTVSTHSTLSTKLFRKRMSDVLTFLEETKIRHAIIVHGYTRCFSTSNMKVPIDIINLCIQYYHIEVDKFDTQNIGKYHSLQGNTITDNTYYGASSSLFCSVVSSGKHKWRFKIKKYRVSYQKSIMIGIWKSKSGHAPKDKCFTNDKKGYGYHVGHGQTHNGNEWKSYGIKCKENDIVSMFVDLTANTLKYSVNGKDYGVAYNIDHTSYKAAIYTCIKKDSVEFLEYTKM